MAGRRPSSETEASTRPSRRTRASRRSRRGRRRRAPRRPAGRASRPPRPSRPQVGQLGAVERLAGPPSTVATRPSAPRAASRRNSCSSERAKFTTPPPRARAPGRSLNGSALSSRGSGGRPSTRSPTIERRISVPPADLRPGMSETARRSGRRPALRVPARRRSGRRPRSPRGSWSPCAGPPLRAGDTALLQRRKRAVAEEAQGEELGSDLAEAVADLAVASAAPSPISALAKRRRASRSPRRRARWPPARTSASSSPAPAAVDRADFAARRRPDRRRRRPR